MLNKDLGIDIKNTIVIKGENLETRDSLSINKIKAFKFALLNLLEVKGLTSSNALSANGSYTYDIHSDRQQEVKKASLV